MPSSRGHGSWRRRELHFTSSVAHHDDCVTDWTGPDSRRRSAQSRKTARSGPSRVGPKGQAVIPRQIRDARGIVPGSFALQLWWTTTSKSGCLAEAIVDQLIEILRKGNVRPLKLLRALTMQAILLCRRSGRISIPDALTRAAARPEGAVPIYPFDQKFPSDGIEPRGA